MYKLSIILSTLLLLLFSSSSNAEIKKTLGDWDVHYIAFTSTFLSPEVARSYGITRSENTTLINISVLDRKTQEAQKVSITGIARNLLGTTSQLQFKEVVEGEAIYYLSTLTNNDEDHMRFVIDITQDKVQQTLKFEQKLYK